MDASFMSLEQHERGIHALMPGRAKTAGVYHRSRGASWERTSTRFEAGTRIVKIN